MKKIAALLLLTAVLFSASALAEAPHDAGWNLPETIEMTDEATALFSSAMNNAPDGVSYEALGFLGEKDGLYCLLCRITAVTPDAKPVYALVYVNEAGLQNTWEIWMDKHAAP